MRLFFVEKLIKNKEELGSMLIGLGIVIAIIVLVVNMVTRNKGNVDVPGVSDEISEIRENKKEIEYVVKSGDSLSKIAKRYYGSFDKWSIIADYNKIDNPDVLLIGQKLKLMNVVEKTKYTVKHGDNLWKIAVTTYGDGYQWPQIWNLNRTIIVNPDLLEVGMMLELP